MVNNLNIHSSLEHERLNVLMDYEILDTLPEPDYDAITQLAAHVCQTPIAHITFVAQTYQWAKSTYGIQVDQASPRESSFCTYTIQTPQAILEVSDARQDERFQAHPAVTGEPYIVFYTGVPLVNTEGQALGALCVVDYQPRQLSKPQLSLLQALARQVITLLELRRNKSQLEAAQQTLRTLNTNLDMRKQLLKAVVNTCPVQLVLWEAVRQGEALVDFRCSFTNSLQAALVGMTPEGMLGTSLKRLFPEVTTNGFFNRLATVLQTRQTQQYQHQQDERNQPGSWGNVTLTPCGDGVLLTAQDITSFKETEEQLRGHAVDLTKVVSERTTQIHQLAALQEAILIHSTMAIVSTDQQAVVQTVNPAAEKLLGYQAAELIGQKLPPILQYVPEGESITTPFTNPPSEGGQSDSNLLKLLVDNRPHECRVRTKAGHLTPILLTSTPILDKSGATIGFVGVATDITPQKEVELMLQKALLREQELNKLKSQFVSTASHEFRTPLATIQSSVDLIKLQLSLGLPADKSQAAIQRQLAIIQHQITSYSALLADVMTLGKIEAGRIHCNPQRVDVPAFVTDIINTHFSDRRDGRAVQVTIKGHPRLIALDTKLIHHALVNLLSNAFKYSSQDPALQIIYEDRKLQLLVVDQGIGIPANEFPHLFDTFFRASNAVNIPGSGLGLVIAREFVERHGGHLSVTSQEHVGTTFSITLPGSPLTDGPQGGH